MSNTFLQTTLLYSGSSNGWSAEVFHSLCDGNGPTITLFLIQNGDCIGGYTKAKWSSSFTDKCDNSAVLFNLTARRSFPSKKTGKDICCGKSYGPYFTAWSDGYDPELAAFPLFNNDCRSYANQPGYSIQLVGEVN